MLSSSSTFYASSPSLSTISPPSRTSRISPSLSTTNASYVKDTIRLRLLSANASLYEILEIPIGSTRQEIKSAYRRLALICHPDVAKNSSLADDFMKIHGAYCTLSDPEKRAVYDRMIFSRRRPLSVGGNGYGGYVGRNWETDQCW
ncbi:hypothetical protein AALP_AA3G339100 [Arabis alpina]|uniref:J domain-containing protein n=1 Tax=Arabis alpina TaxID=50452 RepID=A0A087HDG3_ARAAL|nr:hypothetical protein AALP_AA3G339100 [Arabis alpina]